MNDHVDVILVVGQSLDDLAPLHFPLGCSINSLKTLDGFGLLILIEELGRSWRVGKEEEYNYREKYRRSSLCEKLALEPCTVLIDFVYL